MNIMDDKLNNLLLRGYSTARPQKWWAVPLACIGLCSVLTGNNVIASTIEAEGVRSINVQPLNRRQDLTYCFTTSWEDWYVIPGQEDYEELIIAALPEAEAAWEQWADVDFRYQSELDGATCTTDSAYFVFKLIQNMSSGMEAFRPYEGKTGRVLSVRASLIADSPQKLSSVLKHEFGHILGFQHEERSLADYLDANNNPYDTTKLQRLTPFDYGSVMMKWWHDLATNTAGDTYNMSNFDRLAALCIYTNGISFATCLGQNNLKWDSNESGTRNGEDYIWWNAGSQHQTEQIIGRSQSDGLRIPVSGDFNGDGTDDIFWYGRGNETDWVDFGDGIFVSRPVQGLYDPFAGDFNGDGRDDIFFYGAGTSQDWIWFGKADKTFDAKQFTINGSYQPIVGDFDGDGVDDVFWYRPGTDSDYLWYFNVNKGYASYNFTVNGTYRPVAGDFNGDGDTDILWHTPGTDSDPLWLGRQGLRGSNAFIQRTETVNGDYYPFAGDFDGDGGDEIFWYNPGSGSDPIWKVGPSGFTTSRYESVNGYYSPFTGDFDGDGDDDIFWYAPL